MALSFRNLTITPDAPVAELMETLIERARRRAEADERATVAAAVRRAVSASGLTQAEFAARLRTSGSRLSTYATGRVMPSAALMVRIERLGGGQPSSPDGR